MFPPGYNRDEDDRGPCTGGADCPGECPNPEIAQVNDILPDTCALNLAKIRVLDGGAIPPAPEVPASTRISAKLKLVKGHV